MGNNMNGSNYIFVGGVPRSGTSLVQKMLDLHPDIYGGPEFDHLLALTRVYQQMLKGYATKRQQCYYSVEDLRGSFAAFIDSLLDSKRKEKGVKYLSEKTPANILCFKELSELYPHAKFIFVLRDPRACLNSLLKVQQRAKQEGVFFTDAKGPLAELETIKYYVGHGEKFYQENPTSCYLVKYENLALNPESEARKLCEFLGIEFLASMLETSRENDTSKFIESSEERAWYTKELYDRNVDASRASSWQSELPPLLIELTEFFLRNGPSILKKEYDLNAVSFMVRFRAFPYYLSYYGISWLISKMSRALIKNNKTHHLR